MYIFAYIYLSISIEWIESGRTALPKNKQTDNRVLRIHIYVYVYIFTCGRLLCLKPRIHMYVDSLGHMTLPTPHHQDNPVGQYIYIHMHIYIYM